MSICPSIWGKKAAMSNWYYFFFLIWYMYIYILFFAIKTVTIREVWEYNITLLVVEIVLKLIISTLDNGQWIRSTLKHIQTSVELFSKIWLLYSTLNGYAQFWASWGEGHINGCSFSNRCHVYLAAQTLPIW